MSVFLLLSTHLQGLHPHVDCRELQLPATVCSPQPLPGSARTVSSSAGFQEPHCMSQRRLRVSPCRGPSPRCRPAPAAACLAFRHGGPACSPALMGAPSAASPRRVCCSAAGRAARPIGRTTLRMPRFAAIHIDCSCCLHPAEVGTAAGFAAWRSWCRISSRGGHCCSSLLASALLEHLGSTRGKSCCSLRSHP